MTNKQALWLSERPVRCFSQRLSYLSNYRPSRYYPICTEELREGELHMAAKLVEMALRHLKGFVQFVTGMTRSNLHLEIMRNSDQEMCTFQLNYHGASWITCTYPKWSPFFFKPHSFCWPIWNIHFISWSNFNRVNLTFETSIFASNANKTYVKFQSVDLWCILFYFTDFI